MRVLDLAHVMAGPTCGRMLADMGADVVKIKSAGGDDTRRMLPPDIAGEAAAFMMMNRNKRGIVLDRKKCAARDVLKRLVASADVLLENYRHDTLAKLGLGYEELRKVNPRPDLLCHLGLWPSGPPAAQGGYDLVAQGLSGLMAITGRRQGAHPSRSARPPVTSPPASSAPWECVRPMHTN